MDDVSENPPATESQGNQENYGDGKLCIKLKFPKPEESDTVETKSDDQIRVCEICNREFSSGKALGGHMRVHVQEKRGELTQTSKNTVKTNRNSVEKSQHLVSLSEKPICPLCGKAFRSLKSLFGHMRCHPEREYRGICPPQTGPYHFSSSSSVSGEREVSNPKFPSWSDTAKRGRRSLIDAATSSSSGDYDLSEEDKKAVYDLMSLAQGEFLVPNSSLTSKNKMEGTNSNSLTIGADFGSKDRVFVSKKLRIGDLGYGSKHNELRIKETVPFEAKGKGKVLFESNKNSFSEDEFEGRDSDGSIWSDELITNMRSNKKKTIKKKLKFRDLKSVEKDGGDDDEDDNNVVEKGPLVKYKCNTCNKCFPSHQALGGHRSSHSKHKTPNQALDSELVLVTKFDDSPLVSQDDELKDSNTIESVEPLYSVPAHKCTICQKSFHTGQALGGHMRCHWTAPGATDGPVSRLATLLPEEEASRTRVLEFDLNELAPMEEEDNGVESQNVAGLLQYGYASSSYNSIA